ncbi:MAG: spermine synthase [Armatimonadetes bacterium]|nr:spermine synthase [Armatimonadota bacterium]
MKERVRIAILTMGFSGLVAEILLLREFLIVFSGNELSIGIVLANWLILEAFGSYVLGRKAEGCQRKLEAFALITVLFSISLLAAVFLIRVLKGTIGISIGESVGLLPMFCSSFLILLPVSVFHGALFTFSCQLYSVFSGQDAPSAGRVYAYETVGTVVGGIACTYLLIPHLDTFQASSGIAALNSAVVLALLAPHPRTGPDKKATLAILTALTLAFLILTGQAHKLHQYSIRAQWRNQHVVHYENSRYGNICVIENEGQYTFFQDGVPNIMTPVPDIGFVEEFVHLPLLAHPEPRRLLILSGGAGGVINEALRHASIEAIDYAELDPLLIDLFRKFPTRLTESELNDRRVRIEHVDGRLLLRATRNKYDLILIGITEPSNLQANRFFTREFLSLASERMNEGGILVLGLPGSLTYSNRELRNLNSSIFHTMRTAFPHVRVIPGDGTNLFLLSGSEEILALDRARIVERLTQRDIRTDVIIPWYIEQKLHRGWQGWFAGFIEGSSQRINSDFNPIGVFYSVSYWNALFAPSLRWLFEELERVTLRAIVLLFATLVLLYVLFRPRTARLLRAGIALCIFTTGFAGMIFGLMLIFAFQSIHGYVFSWIGLLVASFMGGAACGAMLIAAALDRMKSPFRLFAGIELAIIGFSLACPSMILAANAYLGSPEAFSLLAPLFLVVSFVSGLLVGSQFPLANKLHLGSSASITRTAGLLYASDLLGGWLGGIIGALVLLPVLGLVGTCVTVGLLKLTSFIVITGMPNPQS